MRSLHVLAHLLLKGATVMSTWMTIWILLVIHIRRPVLGTTTLVPMMRICQIRTFRTRLRRHLMISRRRRHIRRAIHLGRAGLTPNACQGKGVG